MSTGTPRRVRRPPLRRLAARLGAALAPAVLLLPLAVAGCRQQPVFLSVELVGMDERVPAPRFVVADDAGSPPEYVSLTVERFRPDPGRPGPVRFEPVWQVDHIPLTPAPPELIRYGQSFPGAHLARPAAPLLACQRYVVTAGGAGRTSTGGSIQVNQDGTVTPFGVGPPCPLSGG
jgi:hypothetical protein